MPNSVRRIALDRLVAHPCNPNKMSRANFKKLIRNIEQNGRYEPLVVRPCPQRPGFFQVINGHHRMRALTTLGHKNADVVVWDVDDNQTDILLATLNRLNGSDDLSKKLALLKRLNEKMGSRELAKLLPQTAKQIDRLTDLRLPAAPVELTREDILYPLVFLLRCDQRPIIEKALSVAAQRQSEQNKAKRKAAALVEISRYFIDSYE
ncbi:MAG: ParB-like nuclease domain-containing protein [Phycisphaerales bacterium]|nr:MAG: ParB-like nuclease domain-containing protein [Phycisphaerales bacterium]